MEPSSPHHAGRGREIGGPAEASARLPGAGFPAPANAGCQSTVAPELGGGPGGAYPGYPGTAPGGPPGTASNHSRC
eukprot:872054-Pyramimonas_sp.AAC.1